MDQEEVWDAIARKWSEFRTRTSATVEEFVSARKGKILDVGCGSGQNFLDVDGLEWHGVDFSKEMVELARENAKKKGIGVDLKVSDAVRLPYDDGFFDSVLFFAVIHCIDSADKRKKALEEIFRVLKPGGEALVATWGPKSPRLKNKGKEGYIPWTVGDGEKQMRYTYIFDLDELVKLCKEVGFDVVKSWEDRNVNVVVRKE